MRLYFRFAVLALISFGSLLGNPYVYGSLQKFYTIQSIGAITYPGHEIGFWCIDWSWEEINEEADYVFAMRAEYTPPRPDLKVIFVPYQIHKPWNRTTGHTLPNEFVTEEDLREVETALLAVNTSKFQGISFFEEHYTMHIGFEDGLNYTWLGRELLVGYDIWLADHPDSNQTEWKNEMYLRMVRGYYEYFHNKGLKVGMLVGGGAIVENWKNRDWCKGPEDTFGNPAYTYMKSHLDFIVCYSYISVYDEIIWLKRYWEKLEEDFPTQQKFYILTRKWDYNYDIWEPEAFAVEMKNGLDHNAVLLIYYDNDPPREEAWNWILTGIELYDNNAPYYEYYVEGRNLLTGYVGETYGWVET